MPSHQSQAGAAASQDAAQNTTVPVGESPVEETGVLRSSLPEDPTQPWVLGRLTVPAREICSIPRYSDFNSRPIDQRHVSLVSSSFMQNMEKVSLTALATVEDFTEMNKRGRLIGSLELIDGQHRIHAWRRCSDALTEAGESLEPIQQNWEITFWKRPETRDEVDGFLDRCISLGRAKPSLRHNDVDILTTCARVVEAWAECECEAGTPEFYQELARSLPNRTSKIGRYYQDRVRRLLQESWRMPASEVEWANKLFQFAFIERANGLDFLKPLSTLASRVAGRPMDVFQDARWLQLFSLPWPLLRVGFEGLYEFPTWAEEDVERMCMAMSMARRLLVGRIMQHGFGAPVRGNISAREQIQKLMLMEPFAPFVKPWHQFTACSYTTPQKQRDRLIMDTIIVPSFRLLYKDYNGPLTRDAASAGGFSSYPSAFNPSRTTRTPEASGSRRTRHGNQGAAKDAASEAGSSHSPPASTPSRRTRTPEASGSRRSRHVNQGAAKDAASEAGSSPSPPGSNPSRGTRTLEASGRTRSGQRKQVAENDVASEAGYSPSPSGSNPSRGTRTREPSGRTRSGQREQVAENDVASAAPSSSSAAASPPQRATRTPEPSGSRRSRHGNQGAGKDAASAAPSSSSAAAAPPQRTTRTPEPSAPQRTTRTPEPSAPQRTTRTPEPSGISGSGRLTQDVQNDDRRPDPHVNTSARSTGVVDKDGAEAAVDEQRYRATQGLEGDADEAADSDASAAGAGNGTSTHTASNDDASYHTPRHDDSPSPFQASPSGFIRERRASTGTEGLMLLSLSSSNEETRRQRRGSEPPFSAQLGSPEVPVVVVESMSAPKDQGKAAARSVSSKGKNVSDPQRSQPSPSKGKRSSVRRLSRKRKAAEASSTGGSASKRRRKTSARGSQGAEEVETITILSGESDDGRPPRPVSTRQQDHSLTKRDKVVPVEMGSHNAAERDESGSEANGTPGSDEDMPRRRSADCSYVLTADPIDGELRPTMESRLREPFTDMQSTLATLQYLVQYVYLALVGVDLAGSMDLNVAFMIVESFKGQFHPYPCIITGLDESWGNGDEFTIFTMVQIRGQGGRYPLLLTTLSDEECERRIKQAFPQSIIRL